MLYFYVTIAFTIRLRIILILVCIYVRDNLFHLSKTVSQVRSELPKLHPIPECNVHYVQVQHKPDVDKRFVVPYPRHFISEPALLIHLSAVTNTFSELYVTPPV